MEPQNQEIVASGSPAEVPNDPGYGADLDDDAMSGLHHDANNSFRMCEKKNGGRGKSAAAASACGTFPPVT